MAGPEPRDTTADDGPQPFANLSAAEPPPLAELSAFEDGEFHSLSPRCARDPQYDAVRLRLRRRVAAVAKAFTARVAAGDAPGQEDRSEGPEGGGKRGRLALETRTSLHRPYQFNQGQVRRIWAYITRDKKAKTGLRKILGRELGKDLDAAYRNAYLCVAVEHEALEVSLRMHPDAWYDGQNFKNRASREGLRPLLSVLNTLDGFKLKLADWRGDWSLGALTLERLEEFMKAWVPGEHLLAVERRWPAPEAARGAVTSPEVPGLLVEELLRLVPLYRWAAWSPDSDFLGLG